MKTYDTDPMDLTVYATDGAPRYHSSRACQALRNAQDLSDWDCWDDYCRHDHPRPRPVRDLDLAAAVSAGKWPCHTCYPTPSILPPSNETFGHEPENLYAPGPLGPGDDQVMCAACSRGRDPILWPCTSAIVLGLAPRPCPHCKGNRADLDDPGDWIPEVGMHNPNSVGPCPECNGSGLASTAPQ